MEEALGLSSDRILNELKKHEYLTLHILSSVSLQYRLQTHYEKFRISCPILILHGRATGKNTFQEHVLGYIIIVTSTTKSASLTFILLLTFCSLAALYRLKNAVNDVINGKATR